MKITTDIQNLTGMKRRPQHKIYVTLTGVLVCAFVYLFADYEMSSITKFKTVKAQKTEIKPGSTCLKQHNMVTAFIHNSTKKSEVDDEESSEDTYAGISTLFKFVGQGTNNVPTLPAK